MFFDTQKGAQTKTKVIFGNPCFERGPPNLPYAPLRPKKWVQRGLIPSFVGGLSGQCQPRTAPPTPCVLRPGSARPLHHAATDADPPTVLVLVQEDPTRRIQLPWPQLLGPPRCAVLSTHRSFRVFGRAAWLCKRFERCDTEERRAHGDSRALAFGQASHLNTTHDWRHLDVSSPASLRRHADCRFC